MPLSRDNVEQLRRAMTERRTALTAEIRAGVARSRDDTFSNLAGAVTDRADEAVADLQIDLDNAEVSRDLGELREIDAALVRLDDGGFGVCPDCGEEIAFARLRAQPSALRCLDCQRIHERTYAHPPEPRM